VTNATLYEGAVCQTDGRTGKVLNPSEEVVVGRDVGQLYGVAKAVLRPLFRFAWNIEVEGRANVPASGGAIVAPNHLSVLDHFVVGWALPRRVTYVGKAEYLDSWKTRYIFPAMGMIPIDRGGGSAAERALNAAQRLLESGELFGIYPEGTRSRDGLLHKGHTGVARLALRTGCPIMPVGLQGTLEVQPPDRSVPHLFGTMRVRFGRPIDVSRYHGRSDDRMLLRQITDEVMFEIGQLSGQRYVDTYASRTEESPGSMPAADTARVIGQVPRAGYDDGSAGEGGDPPVNGNGNGNGRRSSADVLRRSAS
jgi:1-acyl-sn-glycerol-3-phosphate acyltransferase